MFKLVTNNMCKNFEQITVQKNPKTHTYKFSN